MQCICNSHSIQVSVYSVNSQISDFTMFTYLILSTDVHRVLVHTAVGVKIVFSWDFIVVMLLLSKQVLL